MTASTEPDRAAVETCRTAFGAVEGPAGVFERFRVVCPAGRVDA